MVFTDTRYRAPALHAKQYLLPATVSPHGQRGLSPPSNFVKVISRDCESPRRRRGYGNGTEAQQGVAASAFTFQQEPHYETTQFLRFNRSAGLRYHHKECIRPAPGPRTRAR